MNSMQIFFNLTKLKSIFLVLQKVHEQIIIHYGNLSTSFETRGESVCLSGDVQSY